MIIEVENLQKQYGEGEGATRALNGISFGIGEGEFVAIMGPSGSGKSTLLQMLGFLDKPTVGSYRFDGKTMAELSDDEVAHTRNKKMGFIFQAFNLLPKTSVLENVKLPLLYSGIKENLWDDMAKESIAKVGLLHRINNQPSQLSGGEQQRVAIARALICNPPVVFADEPTGNLDSVSGKNVMEMLKNLNQEKGHTVVLITHDTKIAEYAKRIIQMRDGLIESDETGPAVQI